MKIEAHQKTEDIKTSTTTESKDIGSPEEEIFEQRDIGIPILTTH